MGVAAQQITDRYAIYLGDCMEVMQSLRGNSIHLSIYSPPFGGLYSYSSSERDLSNSIDYHSFLEHYEFAVEQIARVTMHGRLSAVHCMDIPSGNTGNDHLTDFPGDIIRMHEKHGFYYIARYAVWKEPLAVRNRTMSKHLMHKTVVDDASCCSAAAADWLLMFRKHGANAVPIAHPTGFTSYAGSREPPSDVLRYRNWKGDQIENRYSHWIWRQYASAFWDDIRIDRVLPYREARESDDEKHVHPLQLDVIERVLTLWSNPDEIVLTPFMGVGSEVYSALRLGRRAIGIELKPSYYRQSERNIAHAHDAEPEQERLFTDDYDAPGPMDVHNLAPSDGLNLEADSEAE